MTTTDDGSTQGGLQVGMDVQGTREIVEEVLRGGIDLSLISYLLTALVCATAAWVGSFLAAKGRNLARRQDVGQITQEIESIKNLFSLEQARWQHLSSVSLLAAERRLDALQGAYRLTYLLSEVGTNNEQKAATLLGEMRDWYLGNAVYLPDEARKVFFQAYYAPHRHSAAKEAARHAETEEGKKAEVAKATEEARVLRDAPNQILQCLEIPVFDLGIPELNSDG